MVDPFPGAKRTAQDEWFDANVRHQIGLLRFSAGLRNRVLKLLDDTESELRHEIEDRLRRLRSGGKSAGDLARLRKLLAEVQRIRGAAWDDVKTTWIDEINALAVAEPKFASALLQTVVPVQLSPILPTASELRALVTARPFEGRTLRQWADKVRRDDIERIQGQIRIGVLQGESLQVVSRRVVGTVRLKGANGVTQITRNNAETITRTAVNHIANQARREFFLANDDIVDDELFIATLDGNTTPVCRSYDGERFKVGEGPIPPLHMRCRSLRTAILDAEALGERPIKPVTMRGLVREFGELEGLDVGATRNSIPRGYKLRFDEFARRRTRELVGRVPAKTTYQEFLARQPRMFQDDVLGPTRGRLFREGLTVKDFVDRTGAEIPLDQLARMHSDIFRAAGFDPVAFSG